MPVMSDGGAPLSLSDYLVDEAALLGVVQFTPLEG
jgi:hypothetical protein